MKNKTFCEVAKAMMCDQDILPSLWVEASNIVFYVHNRCHHATLYEKTPEEVLTGEKSSERLDNGGDYALGEFDDFCRKEIIKREVIVSYNLQQNGVAERKKKTFSKASKAMMSDQDLLASLWEEDSSNVVYVHKRGPHAILDEKTLEEVFTSEKSDIKHLRIFRFCVFIHVPKEKGTKMEPSGIKGTFVGYNETSKAYQIYVLGQRQSDFSRDVTYDEDATFYRSREYHLDIDMDEHYAPHDADDPVSNSPCSYVKREEHDIPDDIFDQVDPVEPMGPRDAPPSKRRIDWLRETLHEAKKLAAPPGTFKESKKSQRYSGCVAHMSHIIDAEPSTYEEDVEQRVWKDAMMEEYQKQSRDQKGNLW